MRNAFIANGAKWEENVFIELRDVEPFCVEAIIRRF